MKNRILTFIIGILMGSIITTAGFLIYSKSINNKQNEIMEPFHNNGRQMQRPDGNMENPPAKPDGDFMQETQNT